MRGMRAFRSIWRSLRAPQSKFSGGATPTDMTRAPDHPRVRVGGLKTARLSRKDLMAQMVADCANARIDAKHSPKLVFTANGHSVALSATDRSFREALAEADIVH